MEVCIFHNNKKVMDDIHFRGIKIGLIFLNIMDGVLIICPIALVILWIVYLMRKML